MTQSVIVIGGGIVGVLSAYYLALEGYKVTVLDKNACMGQEASKANANQLSYSYLFPPISPYTFPLLPSIIANTDPVIKIADVRFHPYFWQWCLKALPYMVSKKKFGGVSKEIHSLHEQSKSLMMRFLEQNDDLQFSHNQSGRLMIYDNPDMLNFLSMQARDAGLDMKKLDYDEIIEMEPVVKNRKNKPVGGLYCSSDYVGDCEGFVGSLVKACQRLGVSFQNNSAVDGFEMKNGEIQAVLTKSSKLYADKYVIAAGIWSHDLLKELGLNSDLYAVQGYTYRLPHKDNMGVFNASLVDNKYKIVFTPLDGSLKISSGMFFVKHKKPKHDDVFCELLKERSKEVFPDINYEGAELFTGYRPWKPNSLPQIGPTKIKNLYLNIGQGMLGWTMGHASGYRLAQAMKQG